METSKSIGRGIELNLRSLWQKILENKWLFAISIGVFLFLALFYILLATPKYEVSTSLLIDPSGSNRQLGSSSYVEGGVNLIEIEKNLYNEIGIIRSFSLIKQTVEDLHLDIEYRSGGWLRKKEAYGYFPFEVVLDRSRPQLYDTPFEVVLMANNRYRLVLDASDFNVSNPANGATREVEQDVEISEVYTLGEKVTHDYFTFTLNKPDYPIVEEDFADTTLSFVIRDINSVTNDYAEKLEVNNIDIEASIFKLVSIGPNVEKEVDFLNQLTENYIQNKFDSRNDIASTKAAFIQEQLSVVSDSLVKIELALESFKKKEGAVDLGATASNALTQTQTLQVDRAKLQLNIRYYNTLINYIRNNRNSDEFVIPTAMGITDPLINQSLLELRQLYAERSKKKFFVTDNNEEMNIINGQINDAIETLLGNLRSGIRSARMALGSVSSQINTYTGVIDTLPSREKQLLSIQRQSTLYANLFSYLSQELAKTGIARAESISDTTVLDEPRMIGDGPVSPQKKLLMTLALVMGILVPMAKIVYFSKDDDIQTAGQIMAHTEIPIIASIPRYKTGDNIPANDVSHWKVKEAFRGLSANLKFVTPKNNCCVIGVTSTLPEEGKTFCAINLGISLAETGKKTLVIDADLRLPRIVGEVGKINGKGLSNYLNGKISSPDAIIHPHNTLPNLSFIPTDEAEGNFHELLSGPRMESMIESLRSRYDYIILDTPAVGLVSDFILFSDIIDINLFLLRRNIAKIGFLQGFEKIKNQGKKKKSFIVFNDITDNEDAYGYGQAYGVNKEPPLVKQSLSV